MIFLDTNVVVHALLKPKRQLSQQDIILKAKAKRIVERIDKGEQVLTTVVHFSEMINIFGSFDKSYAKEFAERFLSKKSIRIEPISREMYMIAIAYANEYELDINDCLALVVMTQNNIAVIYSFDADFDSVPGITRRTE